MTKANRDALRAAAMTALWTFVGLFSMSLTGWLQDVVAWATGDGGLVAFPDPAVLVKAAVAAVGAAFAGIGNALFRLAQASGFLPGQPPVYAETRRGDSGQSTAFVNAVVLVVLIVALVLLLRGR